MGELRGGRRWLDRHQRAGRDDQPLTESGTQLAFNLPHGQSFDYGHLLNCGHYLPELEA